MPYCVMLLMYCIGLLYWGYIGVMEKKMETTKKVLGFRNDIRAVLG